MGPIPLPNMGFLGGLKEFITRNAYSDSKIQELLKKNGI
jgi:hypothetical protein